MIFNDIYKSYSRKDLNEELASRVDDYKNQYMQILSNASYVRSVIFDIDVNMRKEYEMYEELYSNFLFKNGGDIDNDGSQYINEIKKLEIFKPKFEELAIKAQLCLIALGEILDEKDKLSSSDILAIGGERLKLGSLFSSIFYKLRSINTNIPTGLDKYSKYCNDKFFELKDMISFLMPDRLSEIEGMDINESNISLMEYMIEEYLYIHKAEVSDFIGLILSNSLVIKDDEDLRNLELKLKIYSLYGGIPLYKSDIYNFYVAKFNYIVKYLSSYDGIYKYLNSSNNHLYCFELDCYLKILAKYQSRLMNLFHEALDDECVDTDGRRKLMGKK